MKHRIRLLMVVGCLILLFYVNDYVATGQIQAQRPVQGQRVNDIGDSSKIGSIPELAPPVRAIGGVTTSGSGEYTIEDPRPLEQVAKLLERKLGTPIWYEDPPWAFSADLVQAADLPANRELAARNPDWRGPLVPRGGSMFLTLPKTLADFRSANPVKLLEAAILSHSQLRNSASFKVVQFGDNEFSIVGTGAASKGGQSVARASPLDRRISLPAADRTIADTLKLICDSTNVRLMVEFRGGAEKSRHVQLGANNEVAREVLARAMRVPGGMKISWVLNYMPDLGTYILGLRPTEAEVVTEAGMQVQTLFWPK